MGEKVKEQSKSKRYKWLIIFVLILCVLGLSILIQTSVAMRDIVPQFTGDNVAPSANVTSFSYTTCGGARVYVTPISFHGANVYLTPNDACWNVTWVANSDGFGLAPVQSGFATGVAPISGCTEVTPQITVHTTMQATPKKA